jgi:hypothetical protein
LYEDEKIAAHHLLTQIAAPDLFAKALSPYRHIAAAMGPDIGSTVNVSGNFRLWELSTPSARNLCQISRRHAQG